MNKIQQLFRKTLADKYIEFQAQKSEPATFLNNLTEEIRKELSKGSLQEKQVSYEKLFLLILEHCDTSWASFFILEAMSSSNFQIKRLGYSLASYTFINDVNSMMMVQNLIIKDIRSSDSRKVNLGLTFASNNPTESLYTGIKSYILTFAKGNAINEMSRNKAITCLNNYLLYDKEVVKEFLLFVDKQISKIEEKGTLYCLIGLFQRVLCLAPELYPTVMKSVFFLLDIKQNWIRLNSIKLLQNLIRKDSRLLAKSQKKIYSLLVTSNSKSIEHSLIDLCIEQYYADESMIKLAIGKIDDFLQNQDLNLNTIGFNLVYKLLLKKPKLIHNYTEILAQKAKINNYALAREIFNIYQTHVTVDDAPILLKQLQGILSEGDKDEKYEAVVVNSVLKISLRDNCSLIKTVKKWVVEEIVSTIPLQCKNKEQLDLFISLITQLRNGGELALELFDSILQVLVQIFQQVNVNSEKVKNNFYIDLISFLLADLGEFSQDIIHQYFEDDEDSFNNFSMILTLYTRLRGKISVDYDSTIYISLIKLIPKFHEENLKTLLEGPVIDLLEGESSPTFQNELSHLLNQTRDSKFCYQSEGTSISIKVEDLDLNSLEIALSDSELKIIQESMDYKSTDTKKHSNLTLNPI